MKQSRNLTRHIKELEDVYTDILNESDNVDTFELEKDVKKDEIKGDGPGVDGVEKKIEDIKESPETVKIQKSHINTSMDKKENIFDKLYSTIMEAGDDFDVDSFEMGIEDEPVDDFEGEESGEEITITLSSDQADVLRDVLSQIDGTGSEIEDLDDGDMLGSDEEGEEDPFPEAVEAQHTSDGTSPGVDPTQLGPKKKNVVRGHASKVTSGGATGKVMDKVGNDGDLADTTAKMTATGGRSNVVTGKITGNNQGLLS